MDTPSPRSMKHTSVRYDPSSMTSPTSPSSPVDSAAVEAAERIRKDVGCFGPGDVPLDRELFFMGAARIITACYAEHKPIGWPMQLELAQQILEDRLAAEQAVRQKLVEVCKSLVAADKAHNIDIAVEDATNSARAAIAEAEKLEDADA